MKGFNVALFVLAVSIPCLGQAAKVSDIANTKHNLSASSANTVKAVSETQICVFCHTPHGANTSAAAPLWNRSYSVETYTPYTSSSMDAITAPPSQAASKMCLSCHDGTLAIGAVNVLGGQANVNINMDGTNAGKMPDGAYGSQSGHTRNLGINLTNDHPIAFTYDASLALADGELRNPGDESHIATRSSGVKPAIPLIDETASGNGKVECVTCHDPHIRGEGGEDIKFLRLNRFQTSNAPTSAVFTEGRDIICLACHRKDGWEYSAHAHDQVADETYTGAAAALRDFPNGLPVWRASCLNCHDTHTVQGSRRLLREGTDSPATPKIGGSPALEETCYQCHAINAGGILTPATQVPDVKTDFNLAVRMPITSVNQPAGTEVHDVLNANLEETQLLLGKGNPTNRHVECTDCHNPHRVIKERLANADPVAGTTAAGTHTHEATTMHTNLASGVLRGSTGVQPTAYFGTEFTHQPISFDQKKGVPSTGAPMNVSQSYVTREYQVCYRCHSNWAFDTLPLLDASGGGTPSGTNGLVAFTNQAMEFQAPAGHEGGDTALGTGAAQSTLRVEVNTQWKQWFRYCCNAGGWYWQADVVTGSLPTDCDDNADANCSCTECSTGPNLQLSQYYGGTQKTCGAGDQANFASPPTGGNSSSPWDGTVWDGLSAQAYNSGKPYSAKQCTKTTPVDFSNNNHRSWHPVEAPTGRTAAVRTISVNTLGFLAPWNDSTGAFVGNQTMYCSDCHGSATAQGSVVPTGGENGNAWGPHGSSENFLLKGKWDYQTGSQKVNTSNDICFKCHDYNAYANRNNLTPPLSGFRDSIALPSATFSCDSTPGLINTNLHIAHARVGTVFTNDYRCANCHVAVPHGWKNKALLINLNDVGPEVGLAKGTQIKAAQRPYYNPPYYLGATNYIINFKSSGNWQKQDCGDENGFSNAFNMINACNNQP